jgi:hypothetical protein
MAPVVNKKVIKMDLCPTKPNKKVIDVGDTNVEVTLTLTTKKPIASIVMTRLEEKAVEPVMTRYQTIIQKEVTRLEAKIVELTKMKDFEGAAELTKATTHTVQNACKSIQAAVDKAVKAQIKADYKSDSNLLEAQIKVGVSISFKVIAITVDATRIGLTMGADVHAIVMLCKHTYELGKIVYDLTKDEPKLREELLTAIGKYSTAKQVRLIDKAKAKKSNLAAFKLKMKDAYAEYQPLSSAAENSRKRYKNQVTSMRQGLEKLSLKTDELQKGLKAPGLNLKQGVQVGAKVMQLKREVRTVYASVKGCEQFSEDMAYLLTEAGVEVDDSTFKERLGSVDTTMDLLKATHELAKLCSDIWELAA